MSELLTSQPISVTLSGTYQFLSQRSRVGAVSLDSQSGVIDLALADNCCPYTIFDFAYAYSYGTGSSPEGANETVNQHIGSVHVLQPLEPFLPQCKDWRPAGLSTTRANNQFAIILGADYANSWSSIASPHLPSEHDSANTFLTSALFDYQFAYFPFRKNKLLDLTKDCVDPRCSLEYPHDYAAFFFEFSSGIQFNTLWLNSSNRALTSTGKQLTYQNIVTLNYSWKPFPERFGFLLAAEWDAPLNSQPLHASPHYYANTATFTGGLTYNYYPGVGAYAKDRWSVSILYSYTAFDPFTESNQLQVRLSYTF